MNKPTTYLATLSTPAPASKSASVGSKKPVGSKRRGRDDDDDGDVDMEESGGHRSKRGRVEMKQELTEDDKPLLYDSLAVSGVIFSRCVYIFV